MKSFKYLVIIIFIAIFALSLICFYEMLSPELYYDFNIKYSAQAQPDVSGIKIAPTIRNNSLLIPSIGVDANLGNIENDLDFGAWLEKTNANYPQVIAIHRFGWATFNILQKTKTTLYNVDKLKIGNMVKVNLDNRQYTYKIIKIESGNATPELINNQLIIYTCQFFNSEARIFVITQFIG